MTPEFIIEILLHWYRKVSLQLRQVPKENQRQEAKVCMVMESRFRTIFV